MCICTYVRTNERMKEQTYICTYVYTFIHWKYGKKLLFAGTTASCLISMITRRRCLEDLGLSPFLKRKIRCMENKNKNV